MLISMTPYDTHLDILLAETQMVEIPLMESIVKCLRCAAIGDANTIDHTKRYTNSFGTTCSFLVNLFCGISGIWFFLLANRSTETVHQKHRHKSHHGWLYFSHPHPLIQLRDLKACRTNRKFMILPSPFFIQSSPGYFWIYFISHLLLFLDCYQPTSTN